MGAVTSTLSAATSALSTINKVTGLFDDSKDDLAHRQLREHKYSKKNV